MFPPPESLGIKVCGVTTADQALAIAAMGVDAIGLNFWPGSKRYLPPDEAQKWPRELREQVTLIGVMVNPDWDLVGSIFDQDWVHLIQLHGDETPEMVATLMERGIPVIKALPVRDAQSLDRIAEYPCHTILLDAYAPGLFGGTGETFPWSLFREAKRCYPNKQFILSGGLNETNVRSAVTGTQPAAVDVASGIESAPGIKDLQRTQRFVQEARLG